MRVTRTQVARVVIGRCAAESRFRYRLDPMRTPGALRVTRRVRSRTVATFRAAALVISWAGLLARPLRHGHFVLVLVMRSMIGLRA